VLEKPTHNTTAITLSPSDSTRATPDPLTLGISASTGRTAALKVATSPVKLSISDETVLSVSQITIDLTSRSSTAVGGLITDIHDLGCQLAELLRSNGDPSQAVSLLNQLLADVKSAL
jgi:hypothetical protein